MFHPRDSVDGADEFLPAEALLRENPLSFCRKAVVPSPSLIGLFDPPPQNPTAVLEPVQQGIERGNVKIERAAGAQLDEFANVVTMAGLFVQQGENQQLSATLFPFVRYRFHICDPHIPIRMRSGGNFSSCRPLRTPSVMS